MQLQFDKFQSAFVFFFSRLSIFFVISLPAHGATQTSATPDLASWVSEVKANGSLEKVLEQFPRYLALVQEGTSQSSLPQFISLPEADFPLLGPFSVLGATELKLALRVGQGFQGKLSALSRSQVTGEKTLESLEAVSPIQALLFKQTAPRSHWRIFIRKPNKKIEAISNLATPSTGPHSGNGAFVAKDVVQTMGTALGYNGVVVAAKGSHVLVQGPEFLLKKGVQAVILKAPPAGEVRIPKRAEETVGVVECSAVQNNFAVFTGLILDESQLAPGLPVSIPTR